MKLLFDQNISHRILRLLPVQFKNSTHVKSENLINFPDNLIWEYAKKHDYVIVTQDSDFNELNSLHGFPPKIIWIRTGNLRTTAILNILVDHYSEIEKFVEDKKFGCFEIIRLK
jgi:predicted nuclease of predicted toxin-antitoxin system